MLGSILTSASSLTHAFFLLLYTLEIHVIITLRRLLLSFNCSYSLRSGEFGDLIVGGVDVLNYVDPRSFQNYVYDEGASTTSNAVGKFTPFA